MEKNRFFILVFVFLYCFTSAPAMSATPDTLDAYLRKGLESFNSREYAQAYQSLLKAFEISPGNYIVNFHLGRAAFETGRYEMAIMIFDRALMIYPDDLRVKLEMARAYQKLGLNDMARKYCNEVLLSHPPEAVKQNIEKFLAYIDRTEQHHFFRGMISLGFDWNDNVWATPVKESIRTVIGEVSLSGPTAEKREDFIYAATAKLDHTYSFPYSPLAWQSSGSAYKALYTKEKELDTLYLSLETGPEYIKGNGVAGLLFTADYLNLENSRYLTSLGGKTFYRYMLTPSLLLTPSLAYKNKRFETTSAKDADNLILSADMAFLFKGFWLDISIGGEHERATDDEFSYNRYLAGLSISRELPLGFTVFGSYNFDRTRYDGRASLFDQSRKDSVHQASFGLRKRLWQSVDLRQSMSVSLGYSYTKAVSNLDLYHYSKNVVNSAFEYRF